MAYADISDMMNLVEECLSSVALEVLGTHEVTFGDKTIVLKDFKKAHMVDLINEETGINFFDKDYFEELKH